MVGKILDTGYVIYNPENDHYVEANDGIFRTRKYPQKRVDGSKYFEGWKVVKVKLVIAEDD